ncbi:glycine--tRNA ligase subunit beta [Myxococcota bacterium]|nr:glycine--tRNA ligase subunit beta [Myxococcota bacterium]MBU1382128.1 glycine--tRNA ligase subunit beta [Myxococcota bacterium]MBU1498130.1 glycine--tRNA ligase subunit beta [Myxococcota bacterium]
MKKDFICELLCEEIPVKEQLVFLNEKKAFENILNSSRLGFESVQIFVTPRRLSIYVHGLDEMQKGLKEEILGPPVDIAEKDGVPTKAGEGFAKKTGIDWKDFHRAEKGGKLCIAYWKIEEGRKSTDVLGAVLPDFIKSIHFSKSMRWCDYEYTFSRPLKSVLALHGTDLVPFNIYNLDSCRKLYGHRFLSPDFVEIERAEDYIELLKRYNVNIDHKERQRLIYVELQALAQDHKLDLIEDPDLLEEVSLLLEQPTVVLGQFSESFLEVPEEAILSAMRKHQRYFGFRKNGALAPYFATALGTRLKDPSLALRGNVRVLSARLSDASFFFREDLSRPLESRKPRLEAMVYHQKLGTLWDKVERIISLSKWFAPICAADPQKAERAAFLCKMDLETHMVYEFPELQGLMGRYYASKQGEDASVSAAVFEHYLPRNAQDFLPSVPEGVTVALADRLDTITGGVAAGLKPTGSADPFALRRNALGLIRITLEHGLSWSLEEGILKAASNLKIPCNGTDIKAFIIDRLRNYLAEKFPKEMVEAVISCGDDNICDVNERINAISRMSQTPSFSPLVALFKRMNILKKAENIGDQIDETALVEKAEIDLNRILQDVTGRVENKTNIGEYTDALEILSTLYEPVDTFFDDEKGVRVMADDEKCRSNRLTLLKQLDQLFRKIADFKMLAGLS